MIITCPACGYENDSAAVGGLTCDRCESALGTARPNKAAPRFAGAPKSAEDPDKKGKSRIWIVAAILLAKGLFLLHHFGGGDRNPPPPAPVLAAPVRPPDKSVLPYELFEPEEQPGAPGGMRTFSVKFNRLAPAPQRPVPFLNVTAGDRTIVQAVNPFLFLQPGDGPHTIGFTLNERELPREGGEIAFQLVRNPRLGGNAANGPESNAVTLRIRPAR